MGKIIVWPSILSLVSALVVLATYISFAAHNSAEGKGCLMSWMSPSYAKLTTFDSKYARLGRKYSLYLYREVDFDEPLVS
jgi:hypothetical protein